MDERDQENVRASLDGVQADDAGDQGDQGGAELRTGTALAVYEPQEVDQVRERRAQMAKWVRSGLAFAAAQTGWGSLAIPEQFEREYLDAMHEVLDVLEEVWPWLGNVGDSRVATVGAFAIPYMIGIICEATVRRQMKKAEREKNQTTIEGRVMLPMADQGEGADDTAAAFGSVSG